MKKKLKLYQNKDSILYILAFFLFLFLFLFNTVNSEEKKKVIIITPDKKYEYSMNKDRQVEINQASVNIKEGGVFIKENICPHQICVNKGMISKEGEFIICVPQEINIKIIGESRLDGVTW
ncbi:MAG: NusG domain II-containing protein [Candidatus Muiribacteriota bacterium]